MSGLTIIATTAGKAIFPLDKTWRLESSVSDSLSREVVRLAGWMAYEQVSQTLDRLGHVSVPAATVWTEAKRQGERLQAQDAGEQARVGVERVQWQDGRYDGKARKAISLDGGMVAVRGEGWKELKVGVVSELETAGSTEQQTVHLKQAHYTAVLGRQRPVQTGAVGAGLASGGAVCRRQRGDGRRRTLDLASGG